MYTPEDLKETKVKGRARFCKGAVRTINDTEEKDGITINRFTGDVEKPQAASET